MSTSEHPRTITIAVHGIEISVKTTQSEDRIRNIAEYVDARMQEVAERSQVISSVKVAIMTAMQIASELPQFQPGFASQEVEERLSQLAKTVDEALCLVESDPTRQGNAIRSWTS